MRGSVTPTTGAMPWDPAGAGQNEWTNFSAFALALPQMEQQPLFNAINFSLCPMDDGPGWSEVAPDMLVRVDGHGVSLEPLGPSLLAFSCGAFFLSYIGFRFSVHSTIDDVAEMRRWKQVRLALAFAMVAGNFVCAVLAWSSPWFGYAGAVATVLLFLLLRSPPESEEKFIREARA